MDEPACGEFRWGEAALRSVLPAGKWWGGGYGHSRYGGIAACRMRGAQRFRAVRWRLSRFIETDGYTDAGAYPAVVFYGGEPFGGVPYEVECFSVENRIKGGADKNIPGIAVLIDGAADDDRDGVAIGEFYAGWEITMFSDVKVPFFLAAAEASFPVPGCGVRQGLACFIDISPLVQESRLCHIIQTSRALNLPLS